MEWLNPRALWLLPLIAILFLFTRRRALEQRWVGNLYVWASSAPPDPAHLAVRRLRRHWLIALQAGFMLAVIAALAHPVFSPRAHQATFIVDVSASMGARDGTGTRLALARDRAVATAAALPRNSRVRVIAAGAAPVDVGEFSSRGADLSAVLRGLTPSDGPTSIADAQNGVRARDGVAGDAYVFTDQSAPAAAALDAAHWIRVGHAAGNLAITALSAARMPVDSTTAEVLVTVRNFGSTTRGSDLELLRGGAIAERESLTVAPGEARSVTFTQRDLDGVIHARLTADDALAADNERWDIVPPVAPIRVRLLTHGGGFLEKALAANRALSLDVSRPSDLDAAAGDVRNSDVLVCDGCRALPSRGPSVLLVPAAPSTDRWQALDSLSLAGPVHPVTSGIDLTGLGARPLPRVRGAVDGETVARAGASPAIIVSDRDGRRVVELNLDLSSSPLPLSVSFPLLLAHAIDWLSGRSEQQAQTIAGDPLVWPMAEVPAKVSATGPDGRAVPVRVTGHALTIAETRRAGVYVMHAGGADRAFAVNPAVESESDLSMPPHDDAAPLLPAPPLAAASADMIDWSAALLIAALLLAAVEWRQFCGGTR